MKKYLTHKEIKETFARSIDELGDFFGTKWTRNAPKIMIFDSRKDMDKAYGKKSERWAWGCADNKNSIYVFTPEKVEIETSHKYTHKSYEALIKHETCHLFFNKIYKKYKPIWLNEGTSLFLAGQDRFGKKPKVFKTFLESVEETKPDVYTEAGFAIELLINNFGKEKFLELLKENRDCKDYEDFKNRFKKLYGFELEYKGFNKLLKSS